VKLIVVEEGPGDEAEPGRMASLEAAFEAAVENTLAIARRETLALAAALQSSNADAAQVAGGRLRWSLACARQFAARSPAMWIRVRARLTAAYDAAAHWLADEPEDEISPERLRRLLQELREPSLGVRPIVADNALIAAFDLDALPLASTTLRGATVMHVTARRTRLDDTDATKARIVHSCFEAASMRASTFDGAVIEDCDLSKANLEGTRWRGTSLTRCLASGTSFLHADLEGAQFVDCDLRDADFQGSPDMSMRGVSFLRCNLAESNWGGRDLSGVSFVDCRMYGIHGRASGLDATIVEGADLAYAGARKRVGTKNELLESWQEDEWTI